jgi:4-aminobutyrate aminotransferase/(S)-3-amino-2-methylpropionate transaminase
MTLGVSSGNIQKKIDDVFSEILLEQKKFMKVKGPDQGKENLVQEKLAEFIKLRGRTFFFNYFSSGRGHGPFTEMIDGSVKYDMITGIGPNLLGHSNPLYIRAVLEAATYDTVMCGNLLTYGPAVELTEKLLSTVKEKSKLRHFWFSCSGSFAGDVALKILWQKKAPKYNVIAFKKAFSGRSIATQDLTYSQEYREGMPKLINVFHAPFYDQNDPVNSLSKTIAALDEIWAAQPDTFCALTIELIQGEGGFIFGPKSFYEGVFKWAKSKGLYIWVDEVQSFARTHQLFAFQMFELDEYVDVVTVGKILQACGTIYTEELNPKPNLIAGTFQGSIASINAGVKTLDFLMDGGFYGPNGRMQELEKKFFSHFEGLKNGSCKNKLGYFGGKGSMLSFEIGDSSKDLTIKFVKELFNNGVLSFYAGYAPTRCRFLIPVAMTDDHIQEVMKIVEKTILEVVK